MLRGFSAPVKLDFEYADHELAFLATHDSDAVCRWDAAQRIFARAILELAARRRNDRPPAVDETLIEMVRALLADTSSDPALITLALTPPAFSVLAEQTSPIDVDNLHAARQFTISAVARALRRDFERVYDKTGSHATYAPDRIQIARRSLKNACLLFLNAVNDPAARALAVRQLDHADNMTDTMGALVALNDTTGPERDAALARFETRWRDEPLVLDKWFALQAVSALAGTLERVRRLALHPAYNPRNPNRVRALIGAFAHANWPRFHDASGAGYAFVAEQLLAIDRSNPQIAARLVAAFNLWRRFDARRAELQRFQLARIADTAGISPDVAEIVSRGLM